MAVENFLSNVEVEEAIKTIDELLVDTVREYPALWKKEVKEYHNLQIRENCWEMIASVLNIPALDCQKRWAQLRNSFTDERRKRERESRSGSGATKRKGFSLYSAMEFLLPYIQSKNKFTNVASTSTVSATSTPFLKRSPLLPVEQLSAPPPKRHALPVVSSTATFPFSTPLSSMPMMGVPTSRVLLPSFPPTSPPMSPMSPPNIPSPALLQESTSAFEVKAPATSGVKVSSCFFDEVSCGETSMYTGFDNMDYETASSTPLARTTTPSQAQSKMTPASTPSTTPNSGLTSPISPNSPYTDTFLSMDDTPSLYSPSSTNKFVDRASDLARSRPAGSKACFNKENPRPKRIGPVEASFVTLSTVLQNHFQNPVQKEAEVIGPCAGEEAFGNFIALELAKMDEEQKKSRSHACCKYYMNNHNYINWFRLLFEFFLFCFYFFI